MDGYGFDTYAETLLDTCLEEVDLIVDEIEEEVTGLHFQTASTTELPVMALMIYTESTEHEVLVEVEDYRFPEVADSVDEVLEMIYDIAGLDPEDEDFSGPSWEDPYMIPHCLLIHELLLTGINLIGELRDRDIEIAENCTVTCGSEDDTWEDPTTFSDAAKDDLSWFEERDQRRALAELIYDTEERQNWLVNLA